MYSLPSISSKRFVKVDAVQRYISTHTAAALKNFRFILSEKSFYINWNHHSIVTQSAGAVEYNDCNSAEE